jgi:vacuolar-type H+-ATPase subunit H
MTMHVPGSDQRADLRVVHDEPSSQSPEHALGLLENARKVADATVAEARDEAERLLAAARERAQQVQKDARELGQRLRADAERESAQARHQAVGEAERILADARAKVAELEASITGLRTEHDTAVGQARELVDRLVAALDQHGAAGQHRQG